MGLLVQDEKKFNNGLTLSNFVISVRGCIGSIVKINRYNDANQTWGHVYRVSFNMYYFASQEAYSNNANWLDCTSEIIELTEEQINLDLFAEIYAHISTSYNQVVALL
jgi:hypothetical protein